MLYRTHVINALEARREEFVTFGRALGEEVCASARRLRALGGRTSAEVRRESGADASRLSFPSDELERAGGVVVPFGQSWRSHEEARRWALEVLRGRVTFAADGSQVFPGREASVPVAAVQVASFENPHAPEGRYLKDVHFEVITPDQILGGARTYESPEQVVAARRFELEAQAVRQFLERRRGWRARGERAPVAFFDNTLLFSSRRKDAEVLFSARYTRALGELVLLSRETEVPVVGYVDPSPAHDSRHLLDPPHAAAPQAGVYDAQLRRAEALALPPLLDSWGDRTVFWHCQRPSL